MNNLFILFLPKLTRLPELLYKGTTEAFREAFLLFFCTYPPKAGGRKKRKRNPPSLYYSLWVAWHISHIFTLLALFIACFVHLLVLFYFFIMDAWVHFQPRLRSFQLRLGRSGQFYSRVDVTIYCMKYDSILLSCIITIVWNRLLNSVFTLANPKNVAYAACISVNIWLSGDSAG